MKYAYQHMIRRQQTNQRRNTETTETTQVIESTKNATKMFKQQYRRATRTENIASSF
jgi:hypothetical protein